MSVLTCPPLKIPYVSALLSSERDFVVHNQDQDWIENITVLTGDFELSQMSPQRDYSPIVRWASRELDVALHRHRTESLRQHEEKTVVLK